MKKSHLTFSILTILLGLIHVGFTRIFYGPLISIEALWFAGTGLALAFLGVANIFLSGRPERSLKWLGALSNLAGLVFITTVAVILKEPQGYLGSVLVLGMLTTMTKIF